MPNSGGGMPSGIAIARVASAASHPPPSEQKPGPGARSRPAASRSRAAPRARARGTATSRRDVGAQCVRGASLPSSKVCPGRPSALPKQQSTKVNASLAPTSFMTQRRAHPRGRETPRPARGAISSRSPIAPATRRIASRLKVSEADYLGLQRLLDSLSFEGVLAARPGQRFKLSARGPRSRTGQRSARALHAAPARLRLRRQPGRRAGDDVFIPPEAMGGAMHGDQGRVRVRARGARGAEGEVVDGRSSAACKRVAGTLRRKGKSAWLEPDDDARSAAPSSCRAAIDARGPEGNSGDGRRRGRRDHHPLARARPERTPRGRIETVLGRPGRARASRRRRSSSSSGSSEAALREGRRARPRPSATRSPRR